jgi:UDP-N-acetyl-D-glucosamine dehydrogenase
MRLGELRLSEERGAMDLTASLRERIVGGTARVSVMGLGYVGLTEAMELARAGFPVTGFDIDRDRVDAVQEGRSYLVDISDEELAAVVRSGQLTATDDFERLGDQDVLLICVPTPLSKSKAPDLSYIIGAVDSIRPRLRRGQLVVLESTTYPGTTTEVVLPALESTGLRAGIDFHLCFSPERINPGDKVHSPATIPRVVGGVTPECADLASHLYRRIAPDVVTVSRPESAEMVKLLENTFRAVNIGLVNELALMCRSLAIDVWEVIDAAATKPFGFMPFYPGPGLGGHCIPIDPLYLSWKARLSGFDPRFIDLAHHVNSSMPRVVVSVATDALNDRGKSLKGSRILVLGVSYKRDVNDARESPALEIIHELDRRHALVDYHDPYVPRLPAAGRAMASVPLDDQRLAQADCVIIATDHTGIDYKRVVDLARLVVDTRNVTRGVAPYRNTIVRL